MTKVTNLLNDLVRGHVMGTSRVSAPMEVATEPPPVVVAGTALDPAIMPHPSPEAHNMLKNMKPPAFKGEERERSKDAVNTFLHKWSDLHAL